MYIYAQYPNPNMFSRIYKGKRNRRQTGDRRPETAGEPETTGAEDRRRRRARESGRLLRLSDDVLLFVLVAFLYIC